MFNADRPTNNSAENKDAPKPAVRVGDPALEVVEVKKQSLKDVEEGLKDLKAWLTQKNKEYEELLNAPEASEGDEKTLTALDEELTITRKEIAAAENVRTMLLNDLGTPEGGRPSPEDILN
jgi:hypothetical protein